MDAIKIKSKSLLILSILIVLFFLSTVSSCISLHKLRGLKDKEMISRLTAEEDKSIALKDKAVTTEKLKRIEQSFEEEKSAHQLAQKALLQEQLINQSLKDELQKVSKLNAALEQDLKDALASKSIAAKK